MLKFNQFIYEAGVAQELREPVAQPQIEPKKPEAVNSDLSKKIGELINKVKSEKKKVEQFDNLPNLYKALYKEIRKNGKEISQDEMIRMYNEKVSISQIRSTYF